MGTKHMSEGERRLQILEAARKVFLRKGYHDTHMDDIVKESKLSKGALYWYYKSKRDVFNAIYLLWFGEILKDLDRILLSGKRSEEKIYDLGLLTVVLLSKEPESFRAMLELYIQALDYRKSWRLLEEFYRELTVRMEKVLREGIKKGELKKDIDVSSIALFITYNIDMLGLIPVVGFKEVDLKKHWDEAFRVILGGISRNKKGRSPGRKK